MTFDQPVLGTKDMLNVSLDIASNDDIAFDAEFTYPDFCEQTITFSGLPKSANLVLDCSGLKGVSGSEILDSEKPVSIEFISSNDNGYDVAFAGTATYEGDNLSFGLYSAAAQNPNAYVAYYNEGNLVAVSVPAADVTITAGEKADVTVSAPEEFDFIRVFVWTDNLTPMMRIHSQAFEVPSEE